MDEYAVIRIKEKSYVDYTFSLLVTFRDPEGNEEESEVILDDPYNDATEELLEWYFEQYISSPYDDIRTSDAVYTIEDYGKELFQCIFTGNIDFRYKVAMQNQGPEKILVEIVGSSLEFQRIYWECLHDPDRNEPLSAQGIVFVRKNVSVLKVKAVVKPSPTINLLIVTARPNEESDVNYRTIQRPLIELIEKTTTPIRPHILRPGTYEALVKHLDGKTGYYHIIHFDLHGSLLDYDAYVNCYRDSYGLQKLREDEFNDGDKAFIFFEGEEMGEAVPVEASQLANLLENRQIPICILNACQSAKQGNSAHETSLGRFLIQKGIQLIVAMRYSVSVSSAEMMMKTLYEQLYNQRPIERAVVSARQELYRKKERKAAYNYIIELEDWLLPVMYQNGRPSLSIRPFTPAEKTQFVRERRIPESVEQYLAYGFFGRDLDILKIEKNLLLRSNILLLQGMGGAGKSTVLKYLSAWWLRTGFIQNVFYFGYDVKAYTLNEIIYHIAQNLYAGSEYASFMGLAPDVQHDSVIDSLRANSYALILDNTESITGEKLAIPNTLPENERRALKKFLARLKGGHSFVIIGSRSNEEWLRQGTFEFNQYVMHGFDYESATNFAHSILQGIGIPVRETVNDADFTRLMELLAGYPLALKAVLPNLKTKSPSMILQDIENGIGEIDEGNIQERTESIIKCIEYAHSNLSEQARRLLVCLAPFQSIVNVSWNFIGEYYKEVIGTGNIESFSQSEFDTVIHEAVQNGFMQELASGSSVRVMSLQPVFTFFLKNRLNSENPQLYDQLQTAFIKYYGFLAHSFYAGITSKESQKAIFWLQLMEYEYENFYRALLLSLDRHESIAYIFSVLEEYLDRKKIYDRRLGLVEMVYQKIASYDISEMNDAMIADYPNILIRLASTYNEFKLYDEAIGINVFLLKQLTMNDRMKTMATRKIIGIVYHELSVTFMHKESKEGNAMAMEYSKKALEYYTENEEYLKANLYRNMGTLYLRGKEYAAAKEYLNMSLDIYRAQGNTYDEGIVHQNLGLIADDEGDSATFKSESLLALEFYKANNKMFDAARIYLNLGANATNQREYADGLLYYQAALRVFVQYNDKHSEAMVYLNLGALYHNQKKYNEAKSYYKKSLDIMIRYPQALTPIGEMLKNVVDLVADTQDKAFEKEIIQLLSVAYGGGDAENIQEWLNKE